MARRRAWRWRAIPIRGTALTGREVRSLARGAFVAGPHDVAWDGLDNAGHPAAAGVYMARLKGTHTLATHHLVLVN